MKTVFPILEVANEHLYLSFASAALGCAALIYFSRKRRSDLPPGPRGYPIVGNIFDLTPTRVWEKFGEFGERYGTLSIPDRPKNPVWTRSDAHGFACTGGITYLNIMGQDMIILNSSKVAADLLDKKSSIYSNRPVLMMCGEMVGWNRALAFTQYGPRFREFRRYMSKLIGTRASAEKFAPLQERETARFVARVMADPGSLAQQIRKWVRLLRPCFCYFVNARDSDVSDSHEHLGLRVLSS